MDKTDKTRKEGHWILIGVEQVTPFTAYLEKQCSECGYTHTQYIPDNYCPKCGSHNEGKYEPTIEEFLKTYEDSYKQNPGKEQSELRYMQSI